MLWYVVSTRAGYGQELGAYGEVLFEITHSLRLGIKRLGVHTGPATIVLLDTAFLFLPSWRI